jgi:phosphoglycolate phosphatase-like HAD superfamily hydrolase
MVSSLADAVAFFDIGNTLASVTLAPSGDHIERLEVFPDVPPALAALRDRGVRLGIISDRGPIPADDVNQALVAAGLWELLVPELVVYGRKDSPGVFELAARRAGAPDPGRRLLFVGEDAAERAQAARAGFLVAPHPLLAMSVLEQPAPDD